MVQFKKVNFIINPASGTPEPILYYINRELKNKGIQWTLDVTQKLKDVDKFTRKAIENCVDLVAVYGGDGTVMKVANTLYTSKIPLAIIPGGTANVLAHDLGIPLNSQDALHQLIKGNLGLRAIDAGLLNNSPFWIRLSTGSFADMVTQTSRAAKNAVGKIDYSINAVKKLNAPDSFSTYTIHSRGKKIKMKGVALMVANSGHTGLPNLSFTNPKSLSDGLLDIILFRRFGFSSLTAFAAKLLSTQSSSNSVVKHWRIKQATIHIEPKTSLLHDDLPSTATTLNIGVKPKALNILAPKIHV